jgi:serine/threonine-protein kinase
VRLAAGDTVGRHRLVRCIGSGASGAVYEAVHVTLGRRVAIKILRSSPLDDRQTKRAHARFLREGRAAAYVTHGHVVDVYDFGLHEGLPFLVMELVEGESLAELLRREGKLPLESAVGILLPILSAVAQLHAAGIVHRDIKPSNILLDRTKDCPKLADFGISRFDDGAPALTNSESTLGTPEYMAPELLRVGAKATEQSDQYALAVTLYECVTGERPFRGGTDYELMHAVVSSDLVLPSRRDATLPRALDAVIALAMDRDPGLRLPSVDDLGAALLPFASDAVASRWTAEFMPGSGRREADIRSSQRALVLGARPRIGAHRERQRRALGVAAAAAAVAAALIAAQRVRPAAPAALAPSVAAQAALQVPAAATAATMVGHVAIAEPVRKTAHEPEPAVGPRSERALPSSPVASTAGVQATCTGTSSGAGQAAPATARSRAPAPAPFVVRSSPASSAAPPAWGDNHAPILDVP